MSDNLFEIRDMEFAYASAQGRSKRDRALRIPSLDIPKGQITAIRGHNGSGKTTLLKILAGLLEPETGRISRPESNRVILVQQEPYLFHSTVYHNLTSPLRFRGIRIPHPDSLVREKLSFVGLEGFEKRKARNLSGGERKRVAIAQALMAGSDVLLLDEPDGNVDSRTSEALEKLILSLKEQGMTIILCSHHKGFAYRTSDIIIDLYKGSPVSHDENIFKGEYVYRDGLYSEFRTRQFCFRCPSQEGQYSTIVVPAENITLSREDVADGRSNRLTGRILSMESYKEGRFTLTLDCGFILKIRASGTLLTMLKLKPGDEVTALFNPSSLRLY